jgi:hypothetical protein
MTSLGPDLTISREKAKKCGRYISGRCIMTTKKCNPKEWCPGWYVEKTYKKRFVLSVTETNSWIKANLPLGPLYDKKGEKKKSMIDKLCSGMLLEKNDGSFILVGDINKNAGICDDCALDPTTMIKRFKILNIAKLAIL